MSHNSSNLFVDNLDTSTIKSDMDLARLFGQYGAVSSCRMLRKDHQRTSGFVNFVRFEDAAKAMNALHNERIGSYKLRIEWDKYIPVQGLPLYVPRWQENADFIVQMAASMREKRVVPDFTNFPSEIRYLMDITAFYVAKFGAVFESIIMQREKNNPAFKLFLDAPDNTSYRNYFVWRVYSLMNGDTLHEWRSAPFQMIEGGPAWFPPSCASNCQLVATKPEVAPSLSDEDRAELLRLLRRVASTSASDVFALSSFMIDHTYVLEDVVEIIVEAVQSGKTAWSIRLGRFYAISDVLHNARNGGASTVQGVRSYIGAFSPHLEAMVKSMYSGAVGTPGAADFVDRTLLSWQEALVYPSQVVTDLLKLKQS